MARSAGAFIALALGLAAPGASHAQTQTQTQAQTQTQTQATLPPTIRAHVETGELIGVQHEHANVFRDIPYAAPPVGPLRWRPPQPAKPWPEPRMAIYPGPSCPQPMRPDGKPNDGAANGPTSEDCLQLNVFAPKAAKKAPVMVWIHGGGFRTGAGWIYDGQSFARDGVVFVAINYRLGPLGYFVTPAIAKDAPPGEPVGNYGQMDQIAALKWVQRNIAAFGGDPHNVTVLGESAGGMATLALLATPAARGLYQKAVVESGGGWFEPTTLARQEQVDQKLLAQIGVPADATAADLRALPVEKLTPMNADYGPFTDGVLMTETPAQALADGHFDDVPLIIGSNSGEDSLLGPGPLPPERYAWLITPKLRAAYAADAAGGDEALARAIFRDRFMGGPARWVAAEASGGKPSWLYYFSYIGSRFRPAKTRASHADEIQYMLDYWGRRTPMSAVSKEDHRMANLMHACWVAFARTSVPSCGGMTWPAYAPAGGQLMEFGAVSGVRFQQRGPELDAIQAFELPRLDLRAQPPPAQARATIRPN